MCIIRMYMCIIRMYMHRNALKAEKIYFGVAM